MTDSKRWDDVSMMIGDRVIDKDNHRIGKVENIAQIADTMEPAWLVVKTSLFGRERLVPIAAVERNGDVVRVPFAKDTVLGSPVPAVPLTVAASEEARLAQHYAAA